MTHELMRSLRARDRAIRLALALLVAVAAYALPAAQAPAKRALSVEDYPKWRSITGPEMSADGNWVTYVLQQTNTIPAEAKPVLHLLNLETNVDVAVANATGGMFAPDSKWIVYHVDPAPGRRGRGGRGGEGAAPPADPAVPPGAPGPTTPTPAPGTPPPAPGATPPGAPAATPPAPPAPPAAVPPPTTPPATQPATPPPAAGAQPGAAPGRGAAAAPPPPRRVELRNLATGVVQSWQEIESFVFSPASTHLVLKRRPPEPAGGAGGRGGAAGAPATDPPAGGGRGGAATTPAGPRGTDVILLDLRTMRHQLLGSVGDIAFNQKGDLLAYTVDATVKDANGLFVFDAKSGRTVAIDNDAKRYNRLAWNEEGTAVAVLKGVDPEGPPGPESNRIVKMRERNNVLIAFPDVPACLDQPAPVKPIVLDPAKAAGFPAKWVVSDRAPLAWSDDNKRVFFGIQEQVPAPDANTRRDRDETPDVDVWNTADERIQSMQMVRADQERNFTFRQAFDVPASRFVKLADETMRDLEVAQDGRWAVGRDTRGYIHDYRRPAADIYRVNTTTGERTLMVKSQMLGSHLFGIAPDGRHFLYWKDNKYQAYDLDAGTARTLGNGAPVSFVDTEFDRPGARPSYGIAGYTSDGKAAVANHRYDLWLLPLDGTPPRNLTSGLGSRKEIRFRYVRLDPPDPQTTPVAQPSGPGGGPGGPGGGGRGGPPRRERTIDLSKPLTLTAYGEWTKQSGYYELANGQLKELVYEDASYSTPTKAAKADRFLFTRQTFSQYPDLRASGPGFAGAKPITNANPQQADYVWGRRILFDFKNKDGVRLQGILALPDDYKAGEKRPMIVTFYEKNSQNLHRYNAPSYLTGMGASPMEAVSRGYLTMLPDVHFRTGASHSDMLECVEAATRKVIEMGYADPKRIAVTGHSYGGEGAAFIGTQSKMFAAVGMGAGVTDLYSDFSQNWGWSYQYPGGSGANGFDYYLYGQGREAVSPWDDPELYRSESALTHAPKVTAPFLIMHGTSDPTVAFQNGLGFYNALRYHGKKAVLLAYPGEGHGLRGIANRKDLTIRYFQFFDHYLKDAPAPKWLSEGVPFLKKDATLKPGT